MPTRTALELLLQRRLRRLCPGFEHATSPCVSPPISTGSSQSMSREWRPCLLLASSCHNVTVSAECTCFFMIQFAIFDYKKLVTGSVNWTRSGIVRSDEVIVPVQDGGPTTNFNGSCATQSRRRSKPEPRSCTFENGTPDQSDGSRVTRTYQEPWMEARSGAAVNTSGCARSKLRCSSVTTRSTRAREISEA